ncbi:MAG TPA: hydroxymethylglutaryl-CoA reductase, degradative [Polyangia bacterium]|nr:hydroxymethylglutaryl-CoA reductase, degradative [Polyangia bacterium]
MTCSSRLPGFYKLSMEERRKLLVEKLGLDDASAAQLAGRLLDEETANHMVENVVGVYGLPLGIGLNFQVNGRDFLVPMCVEEPSVVAAASNAAKMVRAGGGFTAEADDPIMISQVQLVNVRDTVHAKKRIEAHASEIVAACDRAYPSLVQRGGGTRGIEVRVLEGKREGHAGMLAVHLHVDVRDAMGANLVNTIAESVADRLAELAEAQVGLRILSNLADRRCVRVKARVPVELLANGEFDGACVRDGIVSASRFAELDPYRAATHNKGIMNGVDAVAIATGNDWRGVEAGAHAFAATRGANGGYGPLATWRTGADGALEGTIEMPMAVGTVGGTLRVHPGARLALKILGTERAGELGMVMASVGMASNLAALRAMASEGIQRGHMSLHARSVALHVGAVGEQVETIAAELAELGDVRPERAIAILERLRGSPTGAFTRSN